MQVSREEFLQEMKLREIIREHISVVMKEEEQILKEEQQLRSIIRKLILEQEAYKPTTTAEAAADEALEMTTTQVYEKIEGLMELEEKESFEEHFMFYLISFFKEEDAQEPNKLQEQEEINVSLDSQPDDEPTIIPPKDERPSEEEEKFSIPDKDYQGSDYTGQEYAKRAWESVEKQLRNYYSPLTGDTRQQFKKLMIDNYKQYLQNWMSDSAPSPVT